MTDSIREQLGGITFGVLTFFALATALYGLFGYNIYSEMLGFGETEMKILYVIFAVLALERLYALTLEGAV